MLHALSWCHGQLQNDKSVLKTVSLKLWTDGTKICKTGLFSCSVVFFFLFHPLSFYGIFFYQVNITVKLNLFHKDTISITDGKKPQTLIIIELCFSEYCFINCFKHKHSHVSLIKVNCFHNDHFSHTLTQNLPAIS